MEDQCKECEKPTVIVFDSTTGDVICTSCGLVQEQRFIQDCFKEDPDNRKLDFETFLKMELSNPLLSDTKLDLCTLIEDNSNCDNQDSIKSNVSLMTIHEQVLHSSLNSIADFCEVHNLSTVDMHEIQELFKKVHTKRSLKSRNDGLIAGCIFVACSNNNNRLSMHTVHQQFEGLTLKEFRKEINYIKKEFHGEEVNCTQPMVLNPSVYINRFCNAIGLPGNAVRTAHHAALASDMLILKRTPISIAAAVIYLVCDVPRDVPDKQLLDHISEKTGVSAKTIYATFKDLLPHEALLLPD